jgi:hypothetical protein
MSKLEINKVYALKHDLTNPNADRRQKFDWRYQVQWPAGMRFKVRSTHINDDLILPSIYSGTYRHQDILLRNASNWLLDSLVEVEPTLNEQLEFRDLLGFKSDAIDMLIKNGVITVEQVIAAAQQAAEAQS